MFKPFLVLMFLLLPLVKAAGQDSDVYTSLEEAMKDPDGVEKLDLSKNRLEEFPQEILGFKNLRELYLGKNKIKIIPKDINKLTNLEVLDLGKNRIEEIPVELFDCISLKRLILNQNQIRLIPTEIWKLQELVYLDMWSNELETLPESISKCPKLKEVDLRVINIPNAEQQRIVRLLPKATVHMSASCNCSN